MQLFFPVFSFLILDENLLSPFFFINHSTLPLHPADFLFCSSPAELFPVSSESPCWDVFLYDQIIGQIRQKNGTQVHISWRFQLIQYVIPPLFKWEHR